MDKVEKIWHNPNMEQKEKIVLTGDRPTGRLHLGHYIGSIQNRIRLQDEADKAFYMVADIQALTDNADNPEKVRSNVMEVVLDNLACGLDPKKTTMFVQSGITGIAELTVLFLNLVTLARLKRNPTVKSEMLQKGYGEEVPAGFLMYPVSQAADILIVKANTVPVGEDQKPMIEQTNEIGDKFNSMYGEVFPHVKGIFSENARLVGVDGGAKMSKSLGNCIYLSSTDKEIEDQVRAMYTDPNHVRVEDPGQVEGNVVFTYLDIFDTRKDEVEELKKQYRAGGLGDVVLKKRLTEVLQAIIAPIRERREELAKNPEYVMGILREGTERVQKIGEETVREVKEAIKINYFS
jgi:tryptophanyl-tRNA synthetase